MVSDGSFDPITELLVSIHWFHLHHGLLQADGEPSEVVFAQLAVGFLVHGHARPMSEPACVFVQLPLLHFEGVEFCIGSFLAHNVLEGLGAVIDHVVPNMLVPICIEIYASLDVSVDLLDLVINPFVDVGSLDVPQKYEGLFEGIPHGMGSPIQAIIDFPLGYEPFYFGSVSIEDVRFFANEAIASSIFPWVSSWISPSSGVSGISPSSRVSSVVGVSPRIASTS